MLTLTEGTVAKRKTPYVSTNITVDAREALTTTTLRLAADVGRRIPQSAVLIAALEIANQHHDQLVDLLTREGDPE